MMSLGIGAVTLELDSKLATVVREADAADVDIADAKEILRAAAKLAEEANKLAKVGRQKEAEVLSEKAKGLKHVGQRLSRVPAAALKDTTGADLIKVKIDPMPSTVVSNATEVLLPGQQTMKPAVTIPANVSLIKIDAGAQTSVPDPVNVPPPTASEVGVEMGVDQGLGTLAKVAIAGAVLGGAWMLFRKRKQG